VKCRNIQINTDEMFPCNSHKIKCRISNQIKHSMQYQSGDLKIKNWAFVTDFLQQGSSKILTSESINKI
jgi:hypothetical protein